MKKILGFLSCAAILLACSKSKIDRDTTQVNIRIQNEAGFALENATVSEVNYGVVTKGQVTGYKVISKPVYAGYCNFSVDGAASGAGYGVCGSPMPPAFNPGYYTFKLEPAQDGTYTMLTVIKE